MHVSPGDGHRQRQAHTVDHEVPLRAQLAAIRRILACRFAPPRTRHALRCRLTPAPNRSVPPFAAAARARGAAAATRRPAASRAGVASRSCHYRSPSPGAESPTGYHS
jgi:hypothetical protein